MNIKLRQRCAMRWVKRRDLGANPGYVEKVMRKTKIGDMGEPVQLFKNFNLILRMNSEHKFPTEDFIPF
jgi:hypothetical protein